MTTRAAQAARLSTLHAVTDQRQISSVQLDATTMGRAHGLDADALERLGIVVAAMAENIVRHAGSGQVILRAVGPQADGCVEILALDKGPGISNMPRAMRDSATPAGGVPRETGLADIRHAADLFDIYTHAGLGTAVVAHVGTAMARDPAACAAESARHGTEGAVCVPLHGEDESGDAWAIDVADARITVLLVDGLGHGPQAAVAARAAMAVFRDAAADTPERILATMHAALRPTRGAALSVTILDRMRRVATFCGVGNVDGRIVANGGGRHMIPQNGIVGHTMPRALPTEVSWPADGRLVMHSDGISSRWRMESYPGLLVRHPALLAGVLFRDFARARDDATVIVLRELLPLPTT